MKVYRYTLISYDILFKLIVFHLELKSGNVAFVKSNPAKPDEKADASKADGREFIRIW